MPRQQFRRVFTKRGLDRTEKKTSRSRQSSCGSWEGAAVRAAATDS